MAIEYRESAGGGTREASADYPLPVGGPVVETIGSRKYDWTSGQKVAIGSGSLATTDLDAVEVLLVPTIDCLVKVGDAPTAAPTAGSIPLAAMVPFTVQMTAGQEVAVIALDTAESGNLYVLPRLED